jgi:hypothetical protein
VHDLGLGDARELVQRLEKCSMKSQSD